MKQALRTRHAEQHRDLGAAARLAEHRDIAGIAAERGNVGLHPFQRGNDVELSGIGRVAEQFGVEVTEMGVAKHIQAMIDRHHDDIAGLGEVITLDADAAARSGDIAAAVNVEHHRPPGAGINARRVNIEYAAIFAERLNRNIPAERAGAIFADLRTAVAVSKRIAHAGPVLDRLRRHEAIGPAGIGGIVHALEFDRAVLARAAQLAVLYLDADHNACSRCILRPQDRGGCDAGCAGSDE